MVERRPSRPHNRGREKRVEKEGPLLKLMRKNREEIERRVRLLAEEREIAARRREKVKLDRESAISNMVSVLTQEKNPQPQDPDYHKELRDSRSEYSQKTSELLEFERARISDLHSLLNDKEIWNIYKKIELTYYRLSTVEQITRALEAYARNIQNNPEKYLRIYGIISWLAE